MERRRALRILQIQPGSYHCHASSGILPIKKKNTGLETNS
jgi:hypothetical protein